MACEDYLDLEEELFWEELYRRGASGQKQSALAKTSTELDDTDDADFGL